MAEGEGVGEAAAQTLNDDHATGELGDEALGLGAAGGGVEREEQACHQEYGQQDDDRDDGGQDAEAAAHQKLSPMPM